MDFSKVSVLQLLMWVLVVAGSIGIVLVVCSAVGVPIPHFIITICWICFAVLIGIIALKFIQSLIGGGTPPPVA